MENNHRVELFKAIPLPCLVIKPVRRSVFTIVDVNDAYLSLTNTRREDLIDKSLADAFPTDPIAANIDQGLYKKKLEKAYSTGEEQTIEVLRYDLRIPGTKGFEERYWNAKYIPIKNKEGKVELILHTSRDITDQILQAKNKQKIQQELDINHQHYKNFIRGNPDGLFRLDLNGKFLHANDSLARLAGLPLDEVLKMDFLPFCAPHHKDRIWNQFRRATKGISVSFEADFISAKQEGMVLKILLMPMVMAGKVLEVHGIAKDITGIRETEKVIMAKSRFLKVNATFINSLLENELDEEALQEAFGVIGNTVDVDRMYYFGAHKDPVTGELLISQKTEWASHPALSQMNNPDMQNMSSAQLKEIMGPLRENMPFSALLSELPDGALKEIFLDQDICSMLLFPIIMENQLYGFIGFDDCTRERIWSEDEVTFLQSLAHSFTGALEKRQARKAIEFREEQLRISEQKFKALVQEGSDLMCILDLNGHYKFVSETSVSILGINPEQLIGTNAFDLVHPADRDDLIKQFHDLLNTKQLNSTPFRFRNGKGEWRWLECKATNLLQDPAVEGIVTNSRDITTIIDQAREIEHINERYRLAATATEDLIYDWDLQEDTVVRFHQSSKDLFGYPSAEVNRKEFWQEHIHPDDLIQERQKLEDFIANSKQRYIRTEYRFKRADGSYAKVVDKGYILRDHTGKAVRLIGATTDVSDITAKEEALKVANERFRMAMKATNEMIWDWEIATDSVTRSSGYKKIFGYDSNQATSVHSFWLTKIARRDQDRIRLSLLEALEDPQQDKWIEEYRIVKANGKLAHVADRGFIIRDKTGKAIRMVGAVLDVTESRRLLRDIRKQNNTLKEIAWEQSHVVRAPLARIKGLLYLLEQENFDQMSMQEVVELLRNSADELDTIVRGIVTRTEEIEIQQPRTKVV